MVKPFNLIPNLRWADCGAGAFTRDAGLSRFSAQPPIALTWGNPATNFALCPWPRPTLGGFECAGRRAVPRPFKWHLVCENILKNKDSPAEKAPHLNSMGKYFYQPSRRSPSAYGPQTFARRWSGESLQFHTKFEVG